MAGNDGFKAIPIGTIGTTKVIDTRPGVIGAVNINASFVGTIQIYDSESGTPAAGELICTFGTPSVWPTEVFHNVHVLRGAVVAATGTPNVTILVE